MFSFIVIAKKRIFQGITRPKVSNAFTAKKETDRLQALHESLNQKKLRIVLVYWLRTFKTHKEKSRMAKNEAPPHIVT